jgi:hypothetical protein
MSLYFSILPKDINSFMYTHYLAKELSVLWRNLLFNEALPPPRGISFGFMRYCAAKGYMKLLEYGWKKDYPSQGLLEAIVTEGNIRTLKWFKAHGHQLHVSLLQNAVKGGHLDMIKWLHSRICGIHADKHSKEWAYQSKCILNPQISYLAAKNDHLPILEWLVKHGCPQHDSLANVAIEKGNLNLLSWLNARGGIKLTRDHFMRAEKTGSIEILEFLKDNKCKTSRHIGREAAARNHVHVLVWLKENNYSLSPHICDDAAELGSMEAVQWARTNGYNWGANTYRQVLTRINYNEKLSPDNKSFVMLAYLDEKQLSKAPECNLVRLECKGGWRSL